jgi:hypothetical protein
MTPVVQETAIDTDSFPAEPDHLDEAGRHGSLLRP